MQRFEEMLNSVKSPHSPARKILNSLDLHKNPYALPKHTSPLLKFQAPFSRVQNPPRWGALWERFYHAAHRYDGGSIIGQ
jgi:hypothetical protein